MIWMENDQMVLGIWMLGAQSMALLRRWGDDALLEEGIHPWGWALIDNKSLACLQFSLLRACCWRHELSAFCFCCHSRSWVLSQPWWIPALCNHNQNKLSSEGSLVMVLDHSHREAPNAVGSIMTFSWVFLSSWSWYFVHGERYKSIFFYIQVSSFSSIVTEDGVFVWMEEGHTVPISYDSWWLQGEEEWVLWKCRRQTLLQRMPHTHAE